MAVPLQTAADVANDYLAIQFVVQQLLSRIRTMDLVQVVSCTNNGGVAQYGFVDVVPLVGQLTGDRQVIPHGRLYRLPYLRMQGGTNAVILDPQPGDIGAAGFCARDISAVKADPPAAVANADAAKGTPPGSLRQFSMADGLYFGGMLNAVPVQFVRFASDGVYVVSPQKIRLEAPTIELAGDVNQTDGDVTMAQNLTVQQNVTVNGSINVPSGDVTAQGTALHTHTHTGVTPGSGTSGPPSP